MKHFTNPLMNKVLHTDVLRSTSSNVYDNTPPVLVAPPPIHVTPDANLVFTFSEPIKLASGTLILIANGLRTNVDIAGNPRITVNGNTLTFDPPAGLAPDTAYEVWITSGAITDLSGNPLLHPNVADFAYALTESFTTSIATAPVNAAGTANNDTIHGSNFADTISGGSGGRDTLWGHDGDDVLHGGNEPPDTSGNILNIFGDFLYGGAGNDILHGNSGQDQLYGGTGDDRLVGGADGDFLYGGDGKDLLDGGAGNDVLDGGAGIDRALFTGLRSDYSITRSQASAAVTVLDNRGAAGDGRDTLTNVERVTFADGHFALDIDGVGGTVYRLYRAAFDRAPDLIGQGFWMEMMDRGVSADTVAASFIGSKEFTDLYGAAPTNAEFVTRLYQNVLDRAPEPGGYNFWMGVLNDGLASRSTVLLAFANGVENSTNVAELIAGGIAYTPFG